MIADRSVLAVITARLDSKGIPRKNLAPLGGKPLIAWTIEAARSAGTVDRIVLSTESPEIADVAAQLGCEVPFMRPERLASDSATSMAVVRDVMDRLGERFDYVVLLQPTSPLRLGSDIDAAVTLCHGRHAPACVTVCQIEKPIEWCYRVGHDHAMQPIASASELVHQRQAGEITYVLNGAVYVALWESLVARESFVTQETVAYAMPRERSVDIDTELDLLIARAIVEQAGRLAPSGVD